jgi:parvulin-like peptidyl-prolyl isomerase
MANALVARVNDDIITREDLVRDLRPDIALWQRALSEQDFQARLRTELRQRLRAEISRRLILQETDRQLNEGQKEYLKKEVEKERTRQVALSGGSLAAWRARLADFGLNEDAWRKFQLEQFTIQAFLNDRIEPQTAVTRDEILACYEQAKKEKYTVQPRAHMQLIKLRLEDHADLEGMLALARSLSGRARKGEDFATLAREYSKDPKAAEGGDWGLLHQGSFRVEAVNEALFTLPVGGVSEPIVDGNAVYIIRVAGRIEGRVIPFTEVQDECRDAAKRAKREKLVAEFVQRLYDKSHIEVHEENL